MSCAKREAERYGSKTRTPTSRPSESASSPEQLTQPQPARSKLPASVKSPPSGSDATLPETTVRQSQCSRDAKSVVKQDDSIETTEVAPVSKDSGETLPNKRPAPAVTIKLGIPKEAVPAKKAKVETLPIKPASSGLVAKAFGSDSEEEEEMPPEAKLRMRNIGKNTPTSSGPNSFNKTAAGFSNPKGSWRKNEDDDDDGY